jgi:hypothetical protein
VDTVGHPDQLPINPEYGFRCGIRHSDNGLTIYTWNGQSWCNTYNSMMESSPPGCPGERCFVGYVEYIAFLDDSGRLEWKTYRLADAKPELVNHPAHYSENGPRIKVFAQGAYEPTERVLECIEVIRWITDGRLFDAMKYIWRVAFGGKAYQDMTLKESKRKDIEKAVWYLKDWLANDIEKD